MNKSQTVGVFFGGKSPEHDVSIITGEFIIAGLKKLGYNVVPIYIDKTGDWHISDSLGLLKFFTSESAGADLKKHNFNKYLLDLELSKEKIVLRRKGLLSTKKIAIDIAFPALHGQNGEDGTIQGLFESFNVPYVGCDVTTSALTMDKVITKQILEANDIPTPPYLSFTRTQWEADKQKILQEIRSQLEWPIFLKPACLGSSIGIKKVSDKTGNELENHIEVILLYDTKVLVEQGVNNLMDLTCCLLGNANPQASLLQESVFQSDLFDFSEKYLNDGGSQLGKSTSGLVIPALLNNESTKDIRELAVSIYKIFNCSGISRVDFLLDKKTSQYYVSEINTMPGTLYHHLWQASGIEVGQILETLIDLARQKNLEKKRRVYTFNSDILKSASGIKSRVKGG